VTFQLWRKVTLLLWANTGMICESVRKEYYKLVPDLVSEDKTTNVT
jgi:hypothetical protein